MRDTGALLQRFLSETQGSSSRVTVDRQAVGGLSQETWLLGIESDGQSRAAVLRLPTRASGTRAIVTQRVALELAHAAGLPVPGVLWADDEAENPFGAPFLVMERIEGEIPTEWNQLAPGRRQLLAERTVELLADLQRVAWANSDARWLRRPKGNPAADELAYYRRRLGALGASPASTVEVALRWLEAHLPPPCDHVLVHNDFRMGNFVVRDEAIAGILDWEMAAVGHPASDLAWCFIAVWELPDLDVEPLVARYRAASERDLDPEVLRWYLALGYLRLVYYTLSGGRSFADGESKDLRQAMLRLEGPVRTDRLLRVIDGDVVI